MRSLTYKKNCVLFIDRYPGPAPVLHTLYKKNPKTTCNNTQTHASKFHDLVKPHQSKIQNHA